MAHVLRKLSSGLKSSIRRKTSAAPSGRATQAMLASCVEFKAQLQRMEREILSAQKSSKVLFSVTRTVLIAPLPTLEGEAPATIGGAAFDPESFFKVSAAMDGELKSQVVAPISKWKASLKALQAKQKDVLRLAADVDFRARQIADITASLDALRTRQVSLAATLAPAPAADGLAPAAAAAGAEPADAPATPAALDAAPAGAGPSKAEQALAQSISELESRLVYKAKKLSVIRASFQEAEAALHASLVGLIREAASVKAIVASAFGVLANAFAAAGPTFGLAAAERAPARPASGPARAAALPAPTATATATVSIDGGLGPLAKAASFSNVRTNPIAGATEFAE